ncbi:MAG: HPF/RaiA family ribosome-associated protein [Pseudobdellovibrionaceae bacterium]
MLKINFKNLEKSELAKEIVTEKLSEVLFKFPEVLDHKLQVTLSMDNSPLKPGPDMFEVMLSIHGEKYKNIIIKKKAKNLYLAISETKDSLLQALNKSGDKARVSSRGAARKVLVVDAESAF